MQDLQDTVQSRSAVIIGHPGHELRVLQFIRKMRPIVAVLTDGSGRGTTTRLELSRHVLQRHEAHITPIYGVVSDRELYRIIVGHCFDFFFTLADQLTDLLVEHDIECVVGDAMEGYNPAHDVCRLLIDRSVHLASKKRGALISNYTFPLIAHPSPDSTETCGLRFLLSADDLALKFSEARRYVTKSGGVLISEVESSLLQYGENAFSREDFFPANTSADLERCKHNKPYYETYGEQQVAAGFYDSVIRFHQHIAPLAAILLT